MSRAKVTAKKKRRKRRPVDDWRPRQQRLTKAQLRRVLEKLAETGNVSAACRFAKAERTAVYRKAERDPAFKEAFEEAKRLGWCGLEDDTLDRARNGWHEPIFHDGEQVGLKTRFSPALNIFLLKAHDPERYRERIDLRAGGPGGGALELNVILDPRAAAEARAKQQRQDEAA